MVNDKYQWLPNGKMISTNTNDNDNYHGPFMINSSK